MIFGNIKDRERYYSVHPRFREALDFLSAMKQDSLPEKGISEEGFRIGIPCGFTDNFDTNKDGSPRLFEAHRDYLDIHYCIAGSEGFGYNDISRLTPETEYDKEGDYQMLSGEVHKLILREGDFCVVFPEDAHIPMLVGDHDGKVMKTVVKIKV